MRRQHFATVRLFTHSFITKGAALFVFIVLFQFLFHYYYNSAILNGNIPQSVSISFLYSEIFITGVVTISIALIDHLVFIYIRHIKPYVFGLLLATYGILFSGSWSQYIYTNHFVTKDSLKMASINPKDIFLHGIHFHHNALYLFLSILILICLLFYIVMRIDYNRLSLKLMAIVNGSFLLALLVAYSHSWPFSLVPINAPVPYNDENTGSVTSWGEVLTDTFLAKTGFHISLLSGIVVDSNEKIDKLDKSDYIWKKQISMKEYHEMDLDNKKTEYNVVFIIIESLRTGIIEPGSELQFAMPCISGIAQESVVFTNHYSTASHSNYADISPLSSHWPLRDTNTHVYPENSTYPKVLIYDILGNLGYCTSIVSSQNENWGKMANYLQTDNLDFLLDSRNFNGHIRRNSESNSKFWRNGKSGKVDDRDTVTRAINWISSHHDGPFFMYMNLQNSHFPYSVGEGFKRPFGKELEHLGFEPSFVFSEVEHMPDIFNRYLDSLNYVDYQLGRFIQSMKDMGIYDKTIIVITGDTGQAFMEHGFAGHANRLFNEVMKTPLIIHAPGLPARVDNRLAQHIDVPPTLLGLLGLPPHPSFQGLDILRDDCCNEREIFLVAQSPFAKEYAIVRGDWKLIYNPFPESILLFNLKVDPYEQHDMSAEKLELKESLVSRLHAWRSAQIVYYKSVNIHSEYYPPLLKSIRTE